MKFSFTLLVALLIASCTSSGPDYYREEGTAISRALVKELKKVRTREELLDHQENIKQLLGKLNKVIQESDAYVRGHPEIEVPPFTRQDQDLSDALLAELNRLLRIEGCRELVNEMLLKPL